MKKVVAVLAMALTLGSLVPVGDAADAKDAALPDAEYPKLVERAVAVIRQSLKDKPDKRGIDKSRTAALMIAAYAQENLNGADGARRATVRDAALAVADLIVNAKDYPKALKLAETLPNLMANEKAKKEKIPLLGKGADYDDLMVQFRASARGGFGIEARFEELGAHPDRAISAKELNESFLSDIYLSAVAAEVIAAYVPEDKAKAKQWQALSLAMRKESFVLADAVKAKDGKAAFKALNQLNRTCDKCHKDFR
ncbi:MAG: cytochrome c [Gemmataceae bacterium]|nr:cytochrome c [Gemmataceae bacterium]